MTARYVSTPLSWLQNQGEVHLTDHNVSTIDGENMLQLRPSCLDGETLPRGENLVVPPVSCLKSEQPEAEHLAATNTRSSKEARLARALGNAMEPKYHLVSN